MTEGVQIVICASCLMLIHKWYGPVSVWTLVGLAFAYETLKRATS